ncbi:MAG: hypothetical protein J6L88_01140 [Clostridia bacterium]|nr:hypothetical protein [Clostridia bacterium]
MKENETGSSKIVPIGQGHAFYQKRAVKHVDRDNVKQAAYFAARAALMQPEDVQSRYELAAIYAQMSRFEQSNALLIGMLHEHPDNEAEVWYALGCNLTAMQQYAFARDALKHCLAIETGDTLLAHEAMDVLEPIEEYCSDDPQDQTTWYLHHRIMEARILLKEGKLEQARDLFAHVDIVEPLFMDTRDDFARTLFLMGDHREAIRLCNWVIKRYPRDVIALCYLVQFYQGTGEEQKLAQTLESLRGLSFERDMESPDDLLEVARAFYVAGCLDEALVRLTSVLRMMPCERCAMHLRAACFYLQGDYDKASQIWRDMTRIDPLDYAANYYLQHTIRVKNGKSNARDRIDPWGALPNSEYMRAIVRLNTLIENMDDARTLWQQHDVQTISLVHWGMTQQALRKTLVVFLCMMGDARAQQMLRNLLFNIAESEGMKQHVCAALKTMGAEEPYYVTALDSIAVVQVQKKELSPQERDSQKVLSMVLDQMEDCLEDGWYDDIESIWNAYTESAQPWTPIVSHAAYAAALVYCYWMQKGSPVTKTSVIRKFETTLATFNRALAKIVAANHNVQKEE